MLLLAFAWIFYFFIHSLLADEKVKHFFRSKFPRAFRFYRLAYAVLSTIGLALILYYQFSLDQFYIIQNAVMKGAGISFLAIGIVLLIASILSYDLGEFTGITYAKGENPALGKLKTNGLNGIVRHPLYFALIILFTGFLLAWFTDVHLLFVTIVFAYLYIGTKLEEKKLTAYFGEEYRQYQKSVKMLIPYVF